MFWVKPIKPFFPQQFCESFWYSLIIKEFPGVIISFSQLFRNERKRWPKNTNPLIGLPDRERFPFVILSQSLFLFKFCWMGHVLSYQLPKTFVKKKDISPRSLSFSFFLSLSLSVSLSLCLSLSISLPLSFYLSFFPSLIYWSSLEVKFCWGNFVGVCFSFIFALNFCWPRKMYSERLESKKESNPLS